MSRSLNLEPVHHVRLTVTNVARSSSFYTEILGFDLAIDGPPPEDSPDHDMAVANLQGGVVLTGAGMLLGLRPADEQRQPGDQFDPFRVGLDHLSFSVRDRDQLVTCAEILDQNDVAHGPVIDLQPFGIAVLSFKDPDGIQLELTAPLPN